MVEAYIIEQDNSLIFCNEEAAHLSEGTPIIEGTFEETTDAWTGTFTSDCGQVYEINDGYISKEAS